MSGELFLGVDGGGTKTEFVLMDLQGKVRARHRAGTSYYLQIGLEGLRQVIGEGVSAVLDEAQKSPDDILYAFFGLPAYGEDSAIQPQLDAMPAAMLGHRRYQCGNDMLCGWAGSLAGQDGINIVAGTGSIGYGERQGRRIRAGGWGEIFSDEGSAYWLAIQGLNTFTRMSDGRLPKGPLHAIFRRHFDLTADLDICSQLMGQDAPARDDIAGLSRLVAEAAQAGDARAVRIYDDCAQELARIVDAIRVRLGFGAGDFVALSYSGGVFAVGDLVLDPLRRHLGAYPCIYDLRPPQFAPGVGAAIYAALLGGALSAEAWSLQRWIEGVRA